MLIEDASLSVGSVVRYDLLSNCKHKYTNVCLELLYYTEVSEELQLMWCDYATRDSALLLSEIWINNTPLIDS
jgi:hypothetical protein